MMAEAEQTKVCPLCAETIKAAAKVCPHCRKSQKRWLFASRFDWLALATPLVFFGTIYLLGNLFIDGRSFTPSRDKFEVLSSQAAVNVASDYTNVVVSGVLTNGSDYAWRTGEFEIRFLDASGKLVDVGVSSDGFVVLAHNDHSFSLTLYSMKLIPEHASRRIKILSANDPSAWFAGD